MPFRAILKELMESVPGAMGAVFADSEGEAVDLVSRNGDSYDVRFMGAHHGILLDASRRTSAAADTGDPSALIIRTEKFDYFTLPVHDGYFVALAVKTGPALLRARMALERAARSLRVEMKY